MSGRPASARTMVCGLLAAAALAGPAAGAGAAAPGWLPAQAISAPGAVGARIALGSRGDGVAVWQRAAGGGSVVEAAAHPAGGGWAAPATPGIPGEQARAPAAAVDGAGNAVAVYERFDGANWRIAVSTRPAASGAWSPPVDISAAGQNARDPRIALDGSGGALAAWEGLSGLSWVVQAAARPPGGDWTAPAQLSDAGAESRNLQIAMAPNGTAVVVWERAIGLQSAVQASVRAGGAGSPPAGQTISESGTSGLAPQAAIDAAGNATVAWQGFDGLRGEAVAVERPAGAASWGAPVALSPADEDARDVRVGVAAAGAGTVLWSRVAAGSWSVRAASRPAVGAPWSMPATVSPAGGSSVQPGGRLAVDAAGNAVAAFAWRAPDASDSALLGVQRPAGGDWLAPVTVAAGPDPASAPELAGDMAGDAVAVWPAGGVLQAAAEDGAPPVIGELTLPAAATAGVAASFSTTALDAWSGLAGGPLWSFGDGVSAAGAAVGHAYDAPGVYPVALVGIDAFGNVSRVSRDVTVGPPAAVAQAPTQRSPGPVAPALRRLAALPARLHPLRPAAGCRPPAPVGLPSGTRCRGGAGVELRFVMSAPGPIALSIRPAAGGRPLMSTRVDGRAGLNRLRLTGWARGRPMPSGTYRVTLRPGLPPARGIATNVGVVVSR